MRRLAVLSVLAGAAALAAAPADAGIHKRRPQHRKVTVNDNFFGPARLTVNRGSTITWVWPDDTGDVHDVKLRKGPKGVHHFHSEPGSAGYRYRRKLTRAGTYRIVCTLHEGMRMTIVVRR